MFLWRSSTKIVQAIMIRQNNRRQGRGLFSLYIYIGNFKNLLFSEPLGRFQYKLAEMLP